MEDIINKKLRGLKKKLTKISGLEADIETGSKQLNAEQMSLVMKKPMIEMLQAEVLSIKEQIDNVNDKNTSTNNTHDIPPAPKATTVATTPSSSSSESDSKSNTEELINMLLKVLHVVNLYKNQTDKEVPEIIEYFCLSLMGETFDCPIEERFEKSRICANNFWNKSTKESIGDSTYLELHSFIFAP